MEFKTSGGRKEIILPPGTTTVDVGPRRTIVVALARAYKWQKMLDTGEVGSMDELAAKYSIDRCYAHRILCLTSLAPNIVEAILADKLPAELPLRRLTQHVAIRWDEQREAMAQ